MLLQWLFLLRINIILFNICVLVKNETFYFIRPIYLITHTISEISHILRFFRLFRFPFRFPMASQKKILGCSGCVIEAIESHDEIRLRKLLSAANVEYTDTHWVSRASHSQFTDAFSLFDHYAFPSFLIPIQ